MKKRNIRGKNHPGRKKCRSWPRWGPPR